MSGTCIDDVENWAVGYIKCNDTLCKEYVEYLVGTTQFIYYSSVDAD